MFKKFNPKEDVANSTSLKSSAQRNIRAAWLEQCPFLSLPAGFQDANAAKAQQQQSAPSEAQASAPSAAAVEQEEAQQDNEAGEDGGDGDDQPRKKSGKGGKKNKDASGGGGGKSGKKGKGKKGDKDEGDDEAATANDASQQQQLVIDEIWPKKEPLGITKCHERISIYTLDSTPLIFQHFDGPLIPTMRLVHKYPDMLPQVQIDTGAIKFLLAGANMMAPGLLSAGGKLPDGLAEGTIVSIMAQGKQHACGVGKLAASSADIKKTKKGVAVEVLTYIGDDLWSIDKLS